MKKKLVSVILTAAMGATLLAGCGNGAADTVEETATEVAETATEVAETATEAAETAEEITDYGTGEVKVWVADNVVDFTNEQIAKFQEAQDNVSSTLSRLLAVREAYPELKADAHFTQLMDQLKEIEAEIAAKREIFNAAVQDYNVLVIKFPKNLVAKMFGFGERAYFEASQAAQEAPKVQF